MSRQPFSHHPQADGGVTCPGDVAKAFGGGADFIMAGGMFAGHDESGGELVEDKEEGKKFKVGRSVLLRFLWLVLTT